MGGLGREVRGKGGGTGVGGVGDGDLHVNVVAPSGYAYRLFLHFLEIVGKDFEGKRAFRNLSRQLAAERFVVGYTSLAHERRVGGKAFDPRICGELEDRFLVGSVGKYLDSQCGNTVRPDTRLPFELFERSR